MKKLSVLCWVLGWVTVSAANVQAQDQGDSPEFQTLLENVSKITIKNSAEMKRAFGTTNFAEILTATLLTGFSPSGDPTYSKNQVTNECEVSRTDKTVSTCMLSVTSSVYHWDDTEKREVNMGGDYEGGTNIRYQVKTMTKDGKTTRSIVGNAVRVIIAG